MAMLFFHAGRTARAPLNIAGVADSAPTLRRLASKWVHRLSEPNKPSAATEAAEVRALARDFLATDPGFASDLLAAADRHQNQYDSQ